jgi:hypothetical protein
MDHAATRTPATNTIIATSKVDVDRYDTWVKRTRQTERHCLGHGKFQNFYAANPVERHVSIIVQCSLHTANGKILTTGRGSHRPEYHLPQPPARQRAFRQSRLIPAARKIDRLVEWRATGIVLISRAAATPTLRAYQSARWAAGIIAAQDSQPLRQPARKPVSASPHAYPHSRNTNEVVPQISGKWGVRSCCSIIPPHYARAPFRSAVYD